MAPIPRLASGPLAVLTGAFLGAINGPKTSTPTSTSPIVWGSEYTGTASFLNLARDATPAVVPSGSEQSTVVYIGCNGENFSSSDPVAFISASQFNADSEKACGQWIEVKSKDLSSHARIVGVCDDCEEGSAKLNVAALQPLIPNVDLDQVVFDDNSDLTLADLTNTEDSKSISPKNLINISWQLSEAPAAASPESEEERQVVFERDVEGDYSGEEAHSDETSNRLYSRASSFSGRATWFSDNFGQCEVKFSQNDMIVAINESQMGKNKKLCGKKIKVSDSKGKSVTLKIVDMCPKKYCKHGDLDISKAAFKKFASLNVGILKLKWSFV